MLHRLQYPRRLRPLPFPALQLWLHHVASGGIPNAVVGSGITREAGRYRVICGRDL